MNNRPKQRLIYTAQQSASPMLHKAGGRNYSKYDTGHDRPGDIRNGEAFSVMHRGKLMFVKPMGKWFRWDGNRWAICTCNEEMEAAKETANNLLDDALQFAATAPKGKRLLTHSPLLALPPSISCALGVSVPCGNRTITRISPVSPTTASEFSRKEYSCHYPV